MDKKEIKCDGIDVITHDGKKLHQILKNGAKTAQAVKKKGDPKD